MKAISLAAGFACAFGASAAKADEGLYRTKGRLTGGSSANTLDEAVRKFADCKPGDIINFSAFWSGVVGRLCDFNKTVVILEGPLGPNVLCVMTTPRPIR